MRAGGLDQGVAPLLLDGVVKAVIVASLTVAAWRGVGGRLALATRAERSARGDDKLPP